jgi:hypothetical protein
MRQFLQAAWLLSFLEDSHFRQSMTDLAQGRIAQHHLAQVPQQVPPQTSLTDILRTLRPGKGEPKPARPSAFFSSDDGRQTFDADRMPCDNPAQLCPRASTCP